MLTALLSPSLLDYLCGHSVDLIVASLSACDTAGFLKVVVDAIDTLVNECTGCEDDSTDTESSGSFQALEVKLESLLQGTYFLV